MKRVFSFSEQPYLFILRQLPSILPGIEKVVVVHFSPDYNCITSDLIQNENGNYIQDSFQVSDNSAVFNRLRSDNAPFIWLRKEDIPFEIVAKERVQLEIFNELNNSILLIRILNTFDNKNDLYFIYFNQDLSNFGTINPNKILSTDNKTIIGHILRNSILTLFENSHSDKNLLISMNENTRAIISERNSLKDELGLTREKFREGLIYLCNSYLADLTKSNRVSYRLSEGALNKIKEYTGDLVNLKSIIAQAAHYAETMNLEGDINKVLISDFHIVIEEPKVQKEIETIEKIEPIGDIPVKYNKTFLLLDKLETAANLVKLKNKLLTGANIGNEFPTPITPPAISDALKKHKQKILHLLHEYPDRWEIIRTEFRPMQNILNAKSYPDQLSA
jgi:hypothetical protein